MTIPATIRPQRTATPPQTPGLIDAEIQVSHLVWTLWQIQQHGHLEGLQLMGLLDALHAAEDCQHRITTLQMMEGR